MDRENMQEVINGMRKIVKPYLAKQLKKINFEGCGNTDKAEFETDFEIVLTLAEQALAIPSAEPKCESCELNRQRFIQTLDVAFELGKMSAEPYKGMTNGEVIKAMFGDDKVSEFMGYARIMAKVGNWFNDGVVAEFDKDWWNSPYEPQESEE